MSAKQPFFAAPVGPNERPWHGFLARITWEETICELCGTLWPGLSEHEEAYSIGTLLDREFVDLCCGKAVDILYGELGDEFARAFLHEFSEDPTDPRFGHLLVAMRIALNGAKGRMGVVGEQVEELTAAMPPS